MPPADPTATRITRLVTRLACGACVAVSALHSSALDVGEAVRFAAMTTDGQTRQASDYQGRLLVVHFWASWHEPSVAHFETLLHTTQHTGAQGVRLLGVCLDDLDQRGNADAVLSRYALDPVGPAPDAGPANWEHTFSQRQTPPLDTRFFTQAYPIPTCLVVGPDGDVLWQGHPAELPAELESLLERYGPDLTADTGTETGDDPEAPTADEPNPGNATGPGTTATDTPTALEAAKARVAATQAAVDDAKSALLTAEDARLADPPDYAQLLTALSSIDELAQADPLIAAHGQRWKRLLGALDADAQAALIAARDADPTAGLALDALMMATAKVDAMQGQDPAPESRVELKMSGARRDQERGRDMAAYDDFLWAVQVAAGTPGVDDALIAVLRYEADPAFMEQLAGAEAESDAQAKLSMAKGYAVSFNEDEAKKLLEDILANYPDTEAAKEAQQMIGSLP